MFVFQNSFKIHPIITNLSKNFILLRLARGLLNTKYLSASTDLYSIMKSTYMRDMVNVNYSRHLGTSA